MASVKKTNPRNTASKAVIAAHILEREALLNACARAIGTVEDKVKAWAKSELTALRNKATTYDAIRADVCARFPRFTGKKKTLSDTPNDSFRSHLDRFKVLACVLGFAEMNDANTYRSADIVALVTGWLNNGNDSLSGLVNRVQEMRRAARPKANLSKEQREAAKQQQHLEQSRTLGEATALNPIAMRALAAALDGASADKLEGFGSVLAELLAATRNAAKRLNDAEKAARLAAKKAA